MKKTLIIVLIIYIHLSLGCIKRKTGRILTEFRESNDCFLFNNLHNPIFLDVFDNSTYHNFTYMDHLCLGSHKTSLYKSINLKKLNLNTKLIFNETLQKANECIKSFSSFNFEEKYIQRAKGYILNYAFQKVLKTSYKLIVAIDIKSIPLPKDNAVFKFVDNLSEIYDNVDLKFVFFTTKYGNEVLFIRYL